MRVHQVAQRADDLERAVDFYQSLLGVPLLARFDPPGLAFFDLGNSRLLLEKGAPSALLYLEVEDIAASFQELAERGIDFVDEPHVIFHDDDGRFGPRGSEEWMVFLHDSEGNLVALVERRMPEDG